MTGSEFFLKQLFRETINLSDDGKIEENSAFKVLAKQGLEARDALYADYQKRPTRAVYLLLKKLREGGKNASNR